MVLFFMDLFGTETYNFVNKMLALGDSVYSYYERITIINSICVL